MKDGIIVTVTLWGERQLQLLIALKYTHRNSAIPQSYVTILTFEQQCKLKAAV